MSIENLKKVCKDLNEQYVVNGIPITAADLKVLMDAVAALDAPAAEPVAKPAMTTSVGTAKA